MADTLRIKRRALGGAAGAPSSLAVGELAYNEQDGALYIGRSNSTVYQVNNYPKVLLFNQSLAGGNAGSIHFASYPAFDSYEFEIIAFATGSPYLGARVSKDGGATFFAGATDYQNAFAYGASNNTGAVGGGAGSLLQLSVGIGGGASTPVFSTGRILYPTATFVGMFRQVLSQSGHTTGALQYSPNFAGTLAVDGSPWTDFLIQFNDGSNFQTNSRWKVWGLR